MAQIQTKRVSLYLTPRELESLRDCAETLNVSQNYVLRLMLRQCTGMPLEPYHIAQLNYLTTIGVQAESTHLHTLPHTSTS